LKDNTVFKGSNSHFDKMTSFKFNTSARYLTFKFLFFKFELLYSASNRRDGYSFEMT